MSRKRGYRAELLEDVKRKRPEGGFGDPSSRRAGAEVMVQDEELLLSHSCPNKGKVNGVVTTMDKLSDANGEPSKGPFHKAKILAKRDETGKGEEQKSICRWSLADEIGLLSVLSEVAGPDAETMTPSGHAKVRWGQLAVKVSERLGRVLTRSQVYEKARSLRVRFINLNYPNDENPTFQDDEEEQFYRFAKKIWGNVSYKLRLYLEDEEETTMEKETNENGNLASEMPLVEEEKETNENRNVASETAQVASPPDKADVLKPRKRVRRPLKKLSYAVLGDNSDYVPEEKSFKGLASKDIHDARGNECEVETMKDFIKSTCKGVLEEMQASFVALISQAMKEMRGSHNPDLWSFQSFHGPLSSFGIVSPGFSADKLSMEARDDVESKMLQERWLKQRTKELQLTSERLKLMLEECQLQQKSVESRLKEMWPASSHS